MKNIAIIGAGMAGLCLGILLKKENINIDIYERQETPGKKILLTGNGKCNLSNDIMDETHYYSDNNEFIHNFFNVHDNSFPYVFFNSIGVFSKNRNGYYYPLSNQASTVLDALINANKSLHNNIICNTYINDYSRDSNKYIVNSKEYDFLIFATGGMAGVYRENEFNSFKLLKSKNYQVERLYPGLTRIISDSDYPKTLSGVRLDCSSRLYYKNELINEEYGEVQFTEKGLSGIPVFQHSLYLGKIIDNVRFNKTELPYILLDLLPEYSEEELFNVINSSLNKQNTINGLSNKKIIKHVLNVLNINEKNISENINKIIKYLKSFKVNITSLDTFKNAQVSSGGLSLNEVTDSFMSKKEKNVYFAGEMLDFTGKCGGYNLSFAFHSARIIAEDILKRLNNADN